MSTANANADETNRTPQELVADLSAWLSREYDEAVSDLAQRYPHEQRHLTINWGDLFTAEPEVAEDYLVAPDRIGDVLTNAVQEIHVPNVELEGVDVRVVGLNDEDVYQPIEVLREDPEGYIGIKGELAKVSEPSKEIQAAAYECLTCGGINTIAQEGESIRHPRECHGCERQGPFEVRPKQSEFTHHAKVRIETPPDETGALQTDTMDGDVRGELVWSGHEEVGVAGRSGDAVTAYGTVEYTQVDENDRHFTAQLDVQALEFDTDADDVDIATHRETFEELAKREDAVDLFAGDLVPQLHATDEWSHALELLVAYLFGAPRIDVPQGPTYRGDIHALIISDYGMGKSMVNSAVAMYSPKCIKESVTGMSSDVGLLAAAVEDDFAGSSWTLRPGILVRANGGHVILDEIDKTDANLERMNDALEGEQLVDVNKAGQSATFKSRVGLLATGNPENSRFNANEPISTQLDIDQSLLSRFDGIVTMTDEADPEQDGAIARTQLGAYLEGQEMQFGDREEPDTLSRTVTPEIGRAWIAHARENITPILSREHFDQITEWYAEEVRQLNENYGENNTGDMPVPANARSVMAVIRFSVAFARVHLRDKVADADVERAMSLSKALIGQNFDGEQFVPQEARGGHTQADRKERIKHALDTETPRTAAEIASIASVGESAAAKELETLRTNGEAVEPTQGKYRAIK